MFGHKYRPDLCLAHRDKGTVYSLFIVLFYILLYKYVSL
jgi:hypothetical protein